MPLQNRVAPDGSLHCSSERGLFTGNRGVIHDPDTKTLMGRRWTTPAWICCSLNWKGRRREVWGRNYKGKFAGWSELFFLDEITALAAGHRPCHTCRREDAMRFHEAYCAANGQRNATAKNRILHAERLHSRKTRPESISISEAENLPNGAVFRCGEQNFALKDGRFLNWSFKGYHASPYIDVEGATHFELVTPRSILGALEKGYQPVWHPSAT